ncbi:MAG: uncharacterized protein KVP18_004255 [Porospora cf. gigantea A]|nr:MAG: hypothetical protein KVP18_004255 [Porospora cf. gigantea A]
MPVLTLQDILEPQSLMTSESFRGSQETADGKGKLRSVAQLMEWSDTDTSALRERLGELPSWLADYTERMNEYQRKLTQKMFSGRPEIPSRFQAIIPGLMEGPQNPLVVFPVMAPHPPPMSSYSEEGEWDITRYVSGIWDLPEVPDVPPDEAFVSTRWISTTIEGEEGYFVHPPIPYLPPHAFFVKRIVDGREVWVPQTEWPGKDYTSVLSAPVDFRRHMHLGSSGAPDGSLSSSTMRAIQDYMQSQQLPRDYRLKQLVIRYVGEGPASTAAFEAIQDYLETGTIPYEPRLKDVVLRYLEAGPEAISTVSALRDYLQSGTLPEDTDTAAMVRAYAEKGLLPRRWEGLIQQYTAGETSTLTPTLLLTRTFVDGYEVYMETGAAPSKLPSRYQAGAYSVTETLMQLPRKYGEVVWVSRRIAGKEVLLPAKLPAGASVWETERDERRERGPDGRFLSEADGYFYPDGGFPPEGFYPDGRFRPIEHAHEEALADRHVVIWPPDEFGDYLRKLQLGDYPSIPGEVARTARKRSEDVLFGQYVVIWPPEEYTIGESAITGLRSARSTRHTELVARLGEGALSGRYVVIWPPDETRYGTKAKSSRTGIRSVWGLDEEEGPTAWRVTIWPPYWREATGIDLSKGFDLRERMAEHARNVVIPVCFTEEIVDDTYVSVAELGHEESVRPDCVVHEVENVDFDVRNIDLSNDPVKIIYNRNRDSASLQSDGDDGLHRLGDYDEYEVIEAQHQKMLFEEESLSMQGMSRSLSRELDFMTKNPQEKAGEDPYVEQPLELQPAQPAEEQPLEPQPVEDLEPQPAQQAEKQPLELQPAQPAEEQPLEPAQKSTPEEFSGSQRPPSDV